MARQLDFKRIRAGGRAQLETSIRHIHAVHPDAFQCPFRGQSDDTDYGKAGRTPHEEGAVIMDFSH
jgi:hypothetical protein